MNHRTDAMQEQLDRDMEERAEDAKRGRPRGRGAPPRSRTVSSKPREDRWQETYTVDGRRAKRSWKEFSTPEEYVNNAGALPGFGG